MTIFSHARMALTGAAATLCALLAACQQPAPPPPPVVVAPPPPPSITLASEITDLAAAYEGYVQRAGAVSPYFTNPDQVQEGVRLGAAYEPTQLRGGAVAYAAVVALQDPAFVSGVRAFVVDPAQRREVAAQIMADPAYVVGIKGSDSAAGLVFDALDGQGRRVWNNGRAVKLAAYEVQRQNWSKGNIVDQPGRLAYAKAVSTQPIRGTTEASSRLQLASTGAAPLGLAPRTQAPPYTPLVLRGMSLAALAALGEAGDANLPNIRLMMAERNTDTCLAMSKLNLYQCLAVAKPHYEDVFCLGQHILMDTGQCIIKGAGGPAPIEIYPRELDLKAARATPVRGGAPAPAPKAPAKRG